MAVINADSCSRTDVVAALAAAVSGDTVVMPAGSATWSSSFNMPAGVTLEGQGLDTIITCTVAAELGTVRLFGGSVLKNIRMIGGASPCWGVSTGAQGWRCTGIVYTSTADNSFFLQLTSGGATWGLIDNCDITGPGPTSELIYCKGPSDAWDYAATFGTDQAIYVEECIFRGQGYVCDANANSKIVVRNCTIAPGIKVDGHGVASNTPERSVRHMEVYRCEWGAATDAVYRAVEHRGGGLMSWGNTNLATDSSGSMRLDEYGLNFSNWGGFSRIQTPLDYPINGQVGRGRFTTPGDWTTAELEPAYLWGNRRPSNVLWPVSLAAITNNTRSTNSETYAEGATSITLTATPPKAGNGIKFTGDATIYEITSVSGNTIGISPPLVVGFTGPITADYGPTYTYRLLTGNPSANFTRAEVIAADRDYFEEGASFDGSSGVGVGTKAQMLAITATKTGVGFWVTDEGDWDTELDAGTSGQLYRWTGAAWELYYVPLTFPHPLRSLPAVPSITGNPSSASRVIGQAVQFVAAASGNPSPSLQWRKGGVAIEGATAGTLTLSNVSLSDAGSYDCVITNSEGSVTTTAATLTVTNVALGSGRIAAATASRGRGGAGVLAGIF